VHSNASSGISRRSFFKATAGVAALSGLAVPKAAGAASSGTGKLATLIDLNLCDGCADRAVPACVTACKDINKDKIPPVAEPIPEPWPRKTVEDWSKKRDASDRLTSYNYIYVQKAGVEANGGKRTVFVPRRCMHCDNPACATICPFSANHKMKNGAVVIDQDLCFGGAKCRTVCPWEIPQRQSGVGIYLHVLPNFMGNGVMYKCDLCNDRLAEGGTPGCVEACPRKAMLIGPRDEIARLAEERAKEMNGHIYGKVENGGTSTFYVSPVSFDLINKTMVKKPGRPDMQPGIGRRMAATDTPGKAVMAAPVLGIVAGLAGAFNWLSRRKTDVAAENPPGGAIAIMKAKGLVARHSVVELFEHWAIALSGLLLILTGFFQMPTANRYFITSVPGLAWSGDFMVSLNVHYAASVVFIAAGLFHLLKHGLRGEKGLLPQRGDFKESVAVIKTFFGKGEEPPFHKYLPEQRLAYAGMAVIILMLVLSGLVKTYKNIYAPDLSYAVVLTATWVHNVFFVLFVLAFFGHIAALVLKPNRPMVRGILTGAVDLDYARRRHPLWMDELEIEAVPAGEVEPPPAAEKKEEHPAVAEAVKPPDGEKAKDAPAEEKIEEKAESDAKEESKPEA